MKESDNEMRQFARFGLVGTYFEIAVDCYIQLQQDQLDYKTITAKGGEWFEGTFIYFEDEKEREYNNKLRKGTIKILIFLAIFLESYINDYAGIGLGDKYTKEYLDKLDFIGKWMIIPRLITGQEIDKGKAYYGQLKELTKWRNKLVHHKSRDATFLTKQLSDISIAKMKPIHEQIDVSSLFNMVKELFEDLDKIDILGRHSFIIESEIARLKYHNK
jgi:hypothetical protein